MDLFDGKQYRETPFLNSTANYLTIPDRNLPVNTTTFSRYRKVFQLSDIFKDMSNLNLERKKFDMLNTMQILEQIDTLDLQIQNRKASNVFSFNKLIDVPVESAGPKVVQNTDRIIDIREKLPQRIQKLPKTTKPKKINVKRFNKLLSYMKDSVGVIRDTSKSIFAFIPPSTKTKVLDGAISKNGSLKTRTWNNFLQSRTIEKNKQKYLMRLHQQYCWAFVCILLLFIGGPMGTIVRKGGFGYPMLVAIGFYMSFVILIILGERLQYSDALSGTMAGWLPFVVLFPFAYMVTFFALKDQRFNLSFIKNLIPQKERS